jgi:uncharacterized membrane protein YphA (DoxX/SURF4 family)
MKRDKIFYWIATGILSAGMAMSAFMYLSSNPELMKSFAQAGYPVYFVMLLGTAKLLGAIALVIPLWDKVKEWAYAGFAFTFIGAIWTHASTDTPWTAPFIALIILSVSYWLRMRIKVA